MPRLDSTSRLGNRDVAALFDEMADLLQIRGGEPHRARAFRRAARIVEHLPEPVHRMLAWGTLEKRRGVGKGTLERVKEMLATGTCGDLERLRAEMPGVQELIKVKGIGASTVRFLHRRFRISTVAELEVLARSGALASLPRFGPEKTAELLHEIEIYKRRSDKVPLAEALATAEEIASRMRALPGAMQVIVAGSSRRRKAMVGDLDILVAADNAAPFIERLTRLPEVAEVLSRRDDGASVRLASLRQVDLRVVSFESWGAALHQLTGAKMHNIALRARFNRRGLKLTERGIWRRADSQLLKTCRREEEIYATLGLPYVEPELRENLGELEAAERGRLPRLIEAGDLRGDLHVAAGEGADAVRAMASAALELRYEYVAVTDRPRRELRDLEQEHGRLHLLAAIEVDVLPDGSLAADPDEMRRHDWVVAAVREALDMSREEMTSRLVRALETGWVDCLAHPTGRLLGERGPCAVAMENLLEAASRLGVALEVNGDPRRMDLDDVSCRQAREKKVTLTLTAAADSPELLGRREFALAPARRGWIEKEDVLNARDVESVRGFRADRLRRHGVVVPAAVAVSGAEAEETSQLATRLAGKPLDGELRRRLRRYLEDGGDVRLHEALCQLSPNPLQEAFNLLAGKDGSHSR